MKNQRSEYATLWADPGELATGISQVLTFGETFNAYCAHRVTAQPAQPFSTTNLLLTFRQDLGKRIAWPDWADLVPLLRSTSRLPPLDQSLLDYLTDLLLEPASVERGPQGTLHIKGATRLPRTLLPANLEFRASFETRNGETHFATRRASGFTQGHSAQVEGLFWDEVINPIALCHRVLMQTYPGRHEADRAEHNLQRALKQIFGLRHFSHEIKYALRDITVRFNELFYGSGRPRLEETQGIRSTTITISYVVGEFQDVLLCYPAVGADDGERLRKAIGLLYFTRFCRVLRLRYFKLSLDEPKPSTIYARFLEARQCVSALRRLEYGYFLNRVFGSLSEISGLNFVFRGGLVPRPDTGRVLVLKGPPGSGKTVFALQKLCGIASRGGLAVYFSFEERTDLLVDRLVTFGLLEPERFEVLAGDLTVAEELAKNRDPKKGALLLYSLGGLAEYPLIDTIKRIGSLGSWRWRALVIDSINALRLSRDEARSHMREFPTLFRSASRVLIEAIESSGYLGIVISEEGSDAFGELEYVCDTIVRFGFSAGERSRWLEIRKCRSQNFHGGHHKVRLVEGEGIAVVPSLGAIRSALRRRTKSTLSRERVVRLSSSDYRGVEEGEDLELAEKSSSLLLGHGGWPQLSLLLRLATQPTILRLRGEQYRREAPRSVLLINFRTTEERFLRALVEDREVYSRWRSLRQAKIRWFSPGETIAGDEVVWEIWRQIQETRRRGVAIERLVICEIENTPFALPTVAREALFWSTLLQMTSAEAITTFLSLGVDSRTADGTVAQDILFTLRSEADYVLLLDRRPKSSTDEDVVYGGEKPMRALTGGQLLSEVGRVSVEKSPPELARATSGAESGLAFDTSDFEGQAEAELTDEESAS